MKQNQAKAKTKVCFSYLEPHAPFSGPGYVSVNFFLSPQMLGQRPYLIGKRCKSLIWWQLSQQKSRPRPFRRLAPGLPTTCRFHSASQTLLKTRGPGSQEVDS